MEKKEYNDFDSLLADLHSEKEAKAEENAVKVKNPEAEQDVDEMLADLYSFKNEKPKEAEPEKQPEAALPLPPSGDLTSGDEPAFSDDEGVPEDVGFVPTDENGNDSDNPPTEEAEADDEDDDDEPEFLTKREKKKIKRANARRRTAAHVVGAVLLCVFIISISAFLSIYIVRGALDLTGIQMTEYDVEIEIPEYSTTDEVAEILVENGIIEMPKLFCIYSQLKDADGKYLSGLFSVKNTMSYSTLIKTLQTKAKVTETIQLRVNEGMTAGEIGKMLEENKVCRAKDFEYYYKMKQNKYTFEKRVLQNSLKFYQLEGYLFPDTYEFYVISDLNENPNMDTGKYAEIAANKMYANFNEKITKEMYKKMNELGFTLDELITLASMVQEEAGTVEDMSLVASVFINRLHSPDVFPKLQSDVTILYIEDWIKPNIGKDALSLYSSVIDAYNTYETTGLPAGPICSPGMNAIEAVLNAPSTDYYYFCADTESLVMYYASTLAEHEQNLKLIEQSGGQSE